MGRIVVPTRIEADCGTCFDLARSQRAHVASTSSTHERIVAGPSHDLLEFGDRITFEARRLAVRQRLTAEVVFTSPLGPLGRLAEFLFPSAHLRRFLARRANAIEAMAEDRTETGTFSPQDNGFAATSTTRP